MKSRFCLCFLIVVLLLPLLTVPALADMIFEPRDDFYSENLDNCDYHNRYYTAKGSGGTVTVWQAPGSGEAVATVNNGNEFYVSFTFTDKTGAVWGVVEFNVDESGNLLPTDYKTYESGWIKMTDLSLVYDYISFAEEHQNAFKPYTGNYEEFKNSGKIVLWTYPGSGVVVLQDESPTVDEWFVISDTYTDGDNRQWGFVGYYLGIKNAWVCISDPTFGSHESDVTAVPSANETPAPDVTPSVPKDQMPMLILTIGIVAAVVLMTGVIIAVFWRKNRSGGKK